MAGGTALALQTVVLGAISTVLYQRFTESIDFGVFAQAWTEIGHGNLDPTNTLQGLPYVRDHFELLMWPVALLEPVVRSPLVLLYLQALAIGGCGMVVHWWTVSLLESRAATAGRPTGGEATVIATVVLGLLLVDPLAYEVAALDFHFEALAACFALLGAFALWRGRRWQGASWLGLCLLCGDVAALLVVGVGVSAVLASRSTRRTGAYVVLAGLGWLALVTALHANQGSQTTTGYAYLAGRQVLPAGMAGATALLGGLAGHPGRALSLLWSRRGALFAYLRPGGVVGLVTPWGVGASVLTLVASALFNSPIFVEEAFQNFPAVPFVTLGTATVLVALASSRRPAARRVAPLVGLGLLVLAASSAVGQLPDVADHGAAGQVVTAGPARALRAVLVRTPPTDAVVASLPVVGRFAQRPVVRWFDPAHPRVLRRPTVVVLAEGYAPQVAPPVADRAAVTVLVHHGGRVLVHRDGIVAVRWQPSPHRRSVVLP